MCNTKTPSVFVQKLWAKLKFIKSRFNVEVWHRKKGLTIRNTIVLYEILIFLLKFIKVFLDRQPGAG